MNWAIAALIITNMIWGAAAPIFKFALLNIPPFLLGFIRFFTAAIILLPLVARAWQKLRLKDYVKIGLIAFFGITLHIAFFFAGLKRGESINASVIGSAGPLVLFIFAVLFLKERFHKKVLMGMGISLIGVLIIVISPLFLGESQQMVKADLSANIFFVLSTIGAVLCPLFAKPILKRVNVLQFTFLVFLFGGAGFVPGAVRELQYFSLSQVNINGWVGILFGVFFSSLIAYYLFFWGTSRIEAQEIGVFSYIDPVLSLAIAIPLLGEYPTKYYFLGAIFVFVGIFIAEGRLHWHPLHRLKS